MMFSKGDIIIINFPFSDLINAKKRPILVLGVRGQDIIGCAVTSNPESEGILINNFQEGDLPFKSKIKYWQIHTFLKDLAIRRIAKISKNTYKEVTDKINGLISA
ncbi:MAG TPA: type II toxin-antitoxin system PemK/MazF family toxin [Candidatus Nanoarchaeia archaeon]|nr:type II toxin-antitoxin system PemK/MazF family toxin [Candidatus Nanoarchaeia archaeon]